MTLFGKVSQSQFVAPVWAKNRHFQTIWPKYAIPVPKLNTIQERVATSDGDFVDLAWYLPPEPKAIAVVFHGLEGSIHSHYIGHLFSTLYRAGMGAVLMHFRGCSGELNLTPRAYHSGDTEDANYILKHVKQRYVDTKLFCVGFSLGGNMLLKLLAEPKEHPVVSAVAVSAPIDLHACAEAINTGFSALYQSHLLKSMKANVLLKMQHVDMTRYLNLTREEIKALSSFRDFDEHITARLHGFASADDYYSKCSAISCLQAINIPTLMLHAADDPFMDNRVIPNNEQLSNSLAYELSAHGGHVGFVHGSPVKPRLWLPERITKFIKAFL
ncbi:hydrolase [Agaribacter flavus]|uniref:Hydrolase n=1 Tax=Agaribacter flavus TaxID=1902781 RepID=A0ABV7FV77_9ALTE